MSAGVEPPRALQVEAPAAGSPAALLAAPANAPLSLVPPESAAAASPGGPAPIPADGNPWARVLRAPGLPTVLRTVLTSLRVVSIDVVGGRLVLAGTSRYAESARGRLALIADICRRELGRSIEIVIQSDDQPIEPYPAEAASVDSRSSAQSPMEVQADAPPGPLPAAAPPMMPSQHPLVREAMELFGARIVDVQHRRPSV